MSDNGNLWDFDFSAWGGEGGETAPPGAELEEAAEPAEKRSHRRRTALLEVSEKYEYRRAFSETKLLDLCGEFRFTEGHSYNFITGGDIDSLSFLKCILRQQDLDYCLASTWCLAGEDIFQFGEWVDGGKIRHLDFYVGEIFPGSYRVEWEMLKDLYARRPGLGRYAVFRNHSKIYAGVGDRFAFGIQSSANINTNPRTEQACITIDRGIYQFYRDYFDGIRTIVKD